MTAPTITCPLAGCVADHGDGDNLHELPDTTIPVLHGCEVSISGFVHPRTGQAGIHLDDREISTAAAREIAYQLLADADRVDLAVLQAAGETR